MGGGLREVALCLGRGGGRPGGGRLCGWLGVLSSLVRDLLGCH